MICGVSLKRTPTAKARLFGAASALMIWYALFWGAGPVAAGDLKSLKPLLCHTDEGKEYHAGGEIRTFNPESVGLATDFVIDFNQAIVKPTGDSYVQRHSTIKQVAHIENKVILLGAEDGVEGVDDGVGWAAAISKDTWQFTISAAGQGVGYIVFGSCTPESE